MQMDIQARKFSLSRALRRHVVRRLRFVADSRYQEVKRVLVRLSALNGRRGGAGKCCLIQIRMPGRKDVVIADSSVNLYAAVNRAAERVAERVGHTLARNLKRRKKKQSGRAGSAEFLLTPVA